MEGEQQSIPGSRPFVEETLVTGEVWTGLAARISQRDAAWIVGMAHHRKVPVPFLAGRLIANAIAACRQTPALIGEILQTEDQP